VITVALLLLTLSVLVVGWGVYYTGNQVMATIQEVNDALDALGTSLGNQLTAIQLEIQQLIDAGDGATEAELQALIDRIATLKTGVDDTITSLGADDPPNP
jgi:predicted PurR-regulated permease PerM